MHVLMGRRLVLVLRFCWWIDFYMYLGEILGFFSVWGRTKTLNSPQVKFLIFLRGSNTFWLLILFVSLCLLGFLRPLPTLRERMLRSLSQPSYPKRKNHVDCFLFSLVKLEGSENKPVNTDFFSSLHSLMLIDKGDNVEQWFSTGGSFTF